MERVPVISENLSEVGWENGVLEIQFHEFSVYQYFDVPSEVFKGLVEAASAGTYFDLYIRNGGYRYEKIL